MNAAAETDLLKAVNQQDTLSEIGDLSAAVTRRTNIPL